MKKYTHFLALIVALVGFNSLVWSMDPDKGPKNPELVELQRLIDVADLKAIKQHIEQAGLNDHLNDTYTCLRRNHPDRPWVSVYEYGSEFATNTNQAIPEVRVPLSYVLKCYSDAESGAMRAFYVSLARYFVDELKVDVQKALESRDQRFLHEAVEHADVEAVQLFVAMGMLDLPLATKFIFDPAIRTVEVDLIAFVNDRLVIVETGIGDAAQKAADSKKLQTILAILEGRYIPNTVIAPHTRIAVAMVALVASVVIIKKMYDWYHPAEVNGETDDVDQDGDQNNQVESIVVE